MRDIPAENSILGYIHCKQCIDEILELAKTSPVRPPMFTRYSIGWTNLGLQIWCERHNINVCHIDFEGMKHPANLVA